MSKEFDELIAELEGLGDMNKSLADDDATDNDEMVDGTELVKALTDELTEVKASFDSFREDTKTAIGHLVGIVKGQAEMFKALQADKADKGRGKQSVTAFAKSIDDGETFMAKAMRLADAGVLSIQEDIAAGSANYDPARLDENLVRKINAAA